MNRPLERIVPRSIGVAQAWRRFEWLLIAVCLAVCVIAALMVRRNSRLRSGRRAISRNSGATWVLPSATARAPASAIPRRAHTTCVSATRRCRRFSSG